MVYSTCTYSEQEDESQLRYLVEEPGAEALPYPGATSLIITPSPLCSYPCYRMMPSPPTWRRALPRTCA